MRTTILVKGAREHNLKNVDLEIPREQFVVFTGMSGSGKSSMAFDTIYAEAQRRFMDSLSAYVRGFMDHLKKPAVDFVYGLSPVISIEQKMVGRNPRSTIGTMTDIYDYLRLLYARTAQAHCPYCRKPVPTRTPAQMLERVLSLPAGSRVEVCAPISRIYGEDYAYLFGEIRQKGCRQIRIGAPMPDLPTNLAAASSDAAAGAPFFLDGEAQEISDDIDLDASQDYAMEVVVDRFIVKPGIDKQFVTAAQAALRLGEGFIHFHLTDADPAILRHFYDGFACPDHRVTMGEIGAYYFSFNEPDSACVTCSGLGTYLKVHPDLLVPDRSRSIVGGCFVPEAFRYDRDTWAGRMMFSLARHYSFSLDVPFQELSPAVVDILFYGTRGSKFELCQPEGAKKDNRHIGKLFRFDGIINDIERRYKHYRRQGAAHSHMENYLSKVMVEHVCPDCEGSKLKRQRMLLTLNGRSIYDLGQLTLEEMKEFLDTLPLESAHTAVAGQIIHEISARLALLLGVGLDYLNLNRRSTTLSGGEGQRIRLSTQIGSGLMGMLYVLDEPSIGLHPKDNIKLIETLRRLRDIGNSVIVVEHDEETIRAADYLVEMGPGPGIHGGQVVAQGTLQEILDHPDSLTGHFLTGRMRIDLPEKRRAATGRSLWIRGCQENNLKGIDVEIPLGLFVCITGASGSGKSTLINEILFKKLYSLLYDSRVLSGKHKAMEGVEHVTDVINIDQTPLGRSPRSNPATYIGVYDDIRTLFANTPEAVERGYTASRFSFNVKGGRCEQCAGDGTITTHLSFMPDVEVPCDACKGTRYNADTLEVTFRGKSIADVLEMSIEETVGFFDKKSSIVNKLGVLHQLGLGYLQVGQSCTTLSGGESQRVKLARELGKIKRGGGRVYILDEPTTGLHFADIQRLLDCLNRLVKAGHTVIVIEHHMDVIKTADWIIDLGPGGGRAGGEIVAAGTPEQVAAIPESYTGQFLRDHLR